MRPIRNRIWLLVLAPAVVFGVAIHIHQTYFFNPLTFRKNNVLYLPFDWYKNPMQLQVWGQRTSTSPQLLYTTFDKNQIHWVLKELDRGQVVDRSEFESSGFEYVHLTLRSGSRPDSPVLQEAFILGPNFNVARIATQVPGRAFSEYITVSPALQKWALSSLQRGKPIH